MVDDYIISRRDYLKGLIWLLLGFLILLLPIILFFSYLGFVKSNNPSWVSNLGTFGDSFGALNTLFTGLAFSGLLISIALQVNSIRSQKRGIR